ncbi:hypothetical protein GS504_13950 [Rhodococcus hoagii]|uniref:Lipoprotein n=1 Tax=Prescottella equi ATCC 33707 TaxID=525370 RepID=E9SYU7_RHOHA|nr:hypothetical protein [Prescottella equi]MBU4615998.1 hypothetical protein [Rhodococcus sp. GG48]EGD25045.1 hypothetical protein HMPREF0724_11580 [Prescottella equi ATCC 33707]MBM4724636.1 hypothetical protein [Prescottella equi]NKR32592.1 hypothetical protein [Prescottella equi]NKR53235.1 hypothetical protein [Prescottella equi]
MNRNRIASAIMIAAATVGFATACSNDDNDSTDASVTASATTTASSASDDLGDKASEMASSASSAASSVASQAGDAVDSAKQAAFVATFRASYSDLATDRDDESIKAITEDTCALREKGATDDELKEAVKGLAANGTTVPSDEQASRILDMAVAACS